MEVIFSIWIKGKVNPAFHVTIFYTKKYPHFIILSSDGSLVTKILTKHYKFIIFLCTYIFFKNLQRFTTSLVFNFNWTFQNWKPEVLFHQKTDSITINTPHVLQELSWNKKVKNPLIRIYTYYYICCLCWSPDRFFGECNVMLATYSVDVLWSNPNCKIRSRTFTYWSFCRWNVDLGGLSSTLPPSYLPSSYLRASF